jgi:hypothetical protein
MSRFGNLQGDLLVRLSDVRLGWPWHDGDNVRLKN